METSVTRWGGAVVIVACVNTDTTKKSDWGSIFSTSRHGSLGTRQDKGTEPEGVMALAQLLEARLPDRGYRGFLRASFRTFLTMRRFFDFRTASFAIASRLPMPRTATKPAS